MTTMNENPVSVEEFELANPALVGAMRNAVRRELELSRADGAESRQARALRRIIGEEIAGAHLTENGNEAIYRIKRATDEVLSQLSALRADLVADHIDVVGDGTDPSIKVVQTSGQMRQALAQQSHPFVPVSGLRGLAELVRCGKKTGTPHVVTSFLQLICIITPIVASALIARQIKALASKEGESK
ncbi:hypothetical protein [Bifidobacterium criceti]|uniref:Uncharacterized protein n=1 Tax=Bifidobacterium criceti TaxID=1960969 RepID=A0A2A2EDX3_9BIFI|nr:hypothetical protein [Bifidobacterium criceti]PAU67190.1 hypothetical protein B1526_1274 [Bifidobacterium criceti]